MCSSSSPSLHLEERFVSPPSIYIFPPFDNLILCHHLPPIQFSSKGLTLRLFRVGSPPPPSNGMRVPATSAPLIPDSYDGVQQNLDLETPPSGDLLPIPLPPSSPDHGVFKVFRFPRLLSPPGRICPLPLVSPPFPPLTFTSKTSKNTLPPNSPNSTPWMAFRNHLWTITLQSLLPLPPHPPFPAPKVTSTN